jgi:integrase
MTKHHAENERIKRAYFTYLEEAKRMATASVDQVTAAIAEFERHTGHKDFRKFHIQQAKAFKAYLNAALNTEKGKPLAKATIRSRLMALKAFFQWLAGQPGYKSRISYHDAEYFNPSANDGRIATAHRTRSVPTLDDIRRVLAHMPTGTDVEKRDRAVIAFAILSGARDDAIASVSLKHVDLGARIVFQDAREVRTKNRKTFTSWFFPVGDDIEITVVDWIGFLTAQQQFGPDDPLFPTTKMGLNEEKLFSVLGLSRAHWKDAAAIRRIFKAAFESVGLPYANPHSFRNTLVRMGEEVYRTPEEFKAWSQNLGHEQMLTTFCSYGTVASRRQGEILASIRARRNGGNNASNDGPPHSETIRRVLNHIKSLTMA